MRLNSVFNFFLGSVLILSHSAYAAETTNVEMQPTSEEGNIAEEEEILRHLDESIRRVEDEKKRLRSHLQELKVTVSTFKGSRPDMIDKINDGLQCTQNRVIALQKNIASTQKTEQKKTPTMRLINFVTKEKLLLVAKGSGVENAATLARLREIRRVTKQKKRMYRRITNNIIVDLQELVEDISEMKEIAKQLPQITDNTEFMKKAMDIVAILTRIEEPEEKKERLSQEIPKLEEQKNKLLEEIAELEAKRDELIEETGVDAIEEQKAEALAEIEREKAKMLKEVEKQRAQLQQEEKAKALRERKAKASEEVQRQKAKALEDIEGQKAKALEDIEKKKLKASGKKKELQKIVEEEEKMLEEIEELKKQKMEEFDKKKVDKIRKLEYGEGKAAMIGTSSVLSLLITGLLVAGAFLYLKKRQKKRENFNQYFQNPVNEVSPAANLSKVSSEKVPSKVKSEKISRRGVPSKVLA